MKELKELTVDEKLELIARQIDRLTRYVIAIDDRQISADSLASRIASDIDYLMGRSL